MNVPDMECIVVVEPQLPNTDVTAQEMKQEENGNASSVVSLQFNDFFFLISICFQMPGDLYKHFVAGFFHVWSCSCEQ